MYSYSRLIERWTPFSRHLLFGWKTALNNRGQSTDTGSLIGKSQGDPGPIDLEHSPARVTGNRKHFPSNVTGSGSAYLFL